MANIVLYRKYRPKTFGEVTGQTHIVQTLQNAVVGDLLSHSYLFSGPRGSGKTSLARLLAKTVNCTSPQKQKTKEPCNACDACNEINANRAIDLIEIDAASNRGIDEMRNLRDSIQFTPAKLQRKVFIIDEAHQLTKEAANALLKTLEEPPAHAMFILATTEAHKMIPTIASRCQRFDFKKLTVPEITKKLEEIAQVENARISKNALLLIATNAEGAMRDALGLLDKVLTFHALGATTGEIQAQEVQELLGIVDMNVIADFTQLLLEKKPADAIDLLNTKLQEGIDPYEFAKNLVTYLRHTLILNINPQLETAFATERTPEQLKRMQAQAAAFEQATLTDMVEHFMEAEQRMKYSSIIQLPLELAIIESTQ